MPHDVRKYGQGTHCDERRCGLKRRRIFDEGAGLRVHRRDDEALSQRGHRCQPHQNLLLARGRRGRTACRAAPWHPLLCLQLFRRLQGAGHRPLHLVLRARRDAKPLHRLQPLPEV